MLRKRAVAIALTALLSPLSFGLGLGTLKSSSALNEPFDARIEIVGATVEDFDALTVKLADSGQFDRAGVARDAVLLNLRFEVVSADAGADYIQITTKDPVREPFLNFLLELDWANGRMIREYTVLLDPPLYDRNRQKPLMTAPAPMPPRSGVQAAPLTPRPASAPAARPASPLDVPASPAVLPSGLLGPVEANETAWGLALAHRPDRSISVQQMMLALLRANPEAFIRDNVNQLRRGAILRMPSREEMDGLAQRDAVQEIQRQHQLWQDYRQGVASTAIEAPMRSPDEVPGTEVKDAIGAVVEDPTTPPADDARLELAAPEDGEAAETPGGEAGGSLDESLAKEDLDSKARENTDLQAKLAEADEIIDLLQRQIKIKDEELAALQARLGGTTFEQPTTEPLATDESATSADEIPTLPETATEDPVATPPVPGEPEPDTSDAPPLSDSVAESPPTAEPPPPVTDTPPAPATEPTVPVAPTTPATGWQATLNNLVPAHLRAAVPGGALTVLGIAATLVLLLLIGISKAMSGRRGHAIVSTKATMATAAAASPSVGLGQRQPTDAPEAMLATREDLTAFQAPKVDSEQFLRTMEASAEQLVAAPVDDPLEEVNVYLAYERFDQAEELVTKVIAKYPYEHKYKLRLLEIYYSANNKPAYEQAARELHAAVGDANPLWESAVAMWTEMSPERALFAPGAVRESDSSREAASAFVDITSDDTLGGSTMSMPPGENDMLSSTQVGLTNDYAGAPTLDFDLSDGIAADTVPSPDPDITEGARGADGIIDLTTTTEDAELDQMLDLTAGMEPADSDIFDISGNEFLDAPSAADNLDLLGVTETGQVTLDAAPAPIDEPINGLLDVTSPGFAAQPDRAEAATINAVVDEMSQEFDISDTVSPVDHAANEGPASTRDDLSLDFDIAGLAGEAPVPAAQDDVGLEDFDLALDSDIESAMSEAAAASADIDLSLQDGITLDFDLADPAGSQMSVDSEVEFDLALQDTTDFENLLIDDTLELPKSNAARGGMRPVDTGESLEDLTRSMEASIAGLDLDDDRDSENILDLALEPGDSDGIDLDFGLDDIGELGELDTLALDPEELRSVADAAIDKKVAIPQDPETEYQLALDETDTKLNLAKAYIELGDGEGARAILTEVIADGTTAQQDEARKLLSQLS